MGKCSKPGGKVRREGRNSGARGISTEKYKRHKWHPKMNLYSKFHPNLTMGQTDSVQNEGKMFRGMGEVGGVGGYRKKIPNVTKVIPKWICSKFSSKSDNGEMFKIRGKGLGKKGGFGGGGEFRKKNEKVTNAIAKCQKFHPNQTMERCSKLVE